MSDPTDPVILSAAGTGLVLDIAGPTVPRVVHWGANPRIPDSDARALVAATRTTTEPADQPTLLPLAADDWPGRPGLAGDRSGRWPYPRPRLTAPATVERDGDAGGTVSFTVADEPAGLSVHTELRLTPEGVVAIRHTVTNTGPDPYTVAALRAILPVPRTARELLDTTGRWSSERVPQRGDLRYGLHAREHRRGRTGHDATGLLVAGTPGFGFRHGQVWAVHTAWSGDQEHYAERLPDTATVLGGAELLAPGELGLAPGQTYQTPWVYFVWSDAGLDGLSDRVHRMLRARPHHPGTARPVVLNTWEAVYFDHDLDRLRALADRAAGIGVERFVLDDGWFRHRRDDTAGLGDWYVDEQAWPAGLHPLVDHVRGLGMQFGLWVEPEMINPDSDLARAHPDWLLAVPGRAPAPSRNQQVLDVARPEASEYLFERLDALVAEYRIDFLKWDHNRELRAPVHDGVAGTHRQTRAVYRLLDRLRARHPGLEIESCSGGGGRIDLGILERTERVWASDTNDPLERQSVQRWTGLLLPPELIGSHVGAARAHVTGRTSDLRFRCATALFGHAGLEWDLAGCTDAELAALTGWIAEYKRLRPLLHGGTVVRADHPDPSAWLHGVVATDRRHAVFCYVQLTNPVDAVPDRLRFPGLAPELRYRVAVRTELSSRRYPPELADRDRDLVLPGTALAASGLAVPHLAPERAVLFELRAT